MIVLIVCIAGIVITGPIIAPPPRLELDVDVSSDRLRSDVERICSEFAPRDYRQTENLDRAADWIAEELRAAGLAVEFQDYEIDEGRYRNVVAYQAGSEPERDALVIGAHYDAFAEFPGANDNASGVAVLLELVRTLPQPDVRRSRYFVAFSTEEPPFFGTDEMGSYFFASSLQERGIGVELMVSLDVVGYYSSDPGSQSFPFPGMQFLYPRQGDFLAVVGDMTSGSAIRHVKTALRATQTIPIHSFRAPTSVPGVDWSDHLSFRKLGMPGVMVTDTAFMRYPHYHTARDTPEKLDYDRMALAVRALHGLLWEGGPP